MVELIGAITGNVGATALFVALIGFLGVLGGALATVFTAGRNVYVNSVTAERSKWIEKLRSNIAKYQNLIDEISVIFDNGERPGKSENVIKKMHEVQHLSGIIKLQLNPDGVVDQSITSLLATTYLLCPSGNTEMLHKAQSLLLSHAQWLLKDEWEVVKYEALPWWSRRQARKKRTKRSEKYEEYLSSEGAIDQVKRAADAQQKKMKEGAW